MTVAFHKVKEQWGHLGNMAPTPIIVDGVEWRSAEALFQAMRFAPDHHARELICKCKSPMAAKMTMKAYNTDLAVEPHSELDIENMRTVLRLKFDQNDSARELLLSTGDEVIVEDCTARANDSGLFWGAAFDGKTWNGVNMLGLLLMDLRAWYRANSPE